MENFKLLLLIAACAFYPLLDAEGETCLQKVGNAPIATLFTVIEPHPTLPNNLVIGTQRGLLELYESSPFSGSLLKRIGQFLDLSSSVSTDGERGLLGFAFHPDYASNGRVFVSMSCTTLQSSQLKCSKEGASVVDEYVVSNPKSAVRITSAPAKRLLEVDQPFSNHNGGQILFSPDGFLMVMLGDGGSAGDPDGNAQNGKTLLGKVLRLDVNSDAGSSPYSIPKSNPFVGDDSVLDEVFALGFRNPWRCSFDRNDVRSGTANAPLYCGDVGQDRVEEIDRVTIGSNAGWNAFEGTSVYNSETVLVGEHNKPVYEYRQEGSAAVIGGYFYRPDDAQRCFSGQYVFADEFNGLKLAKDSFSSVRDLPWKCSSSSPISCGDRLGEIITFGEDQSGDLLIGASKGIFKMVDVAQCNIECQAADRPDGQGTNAASSTQTVPLYLHALVALVVLALARSD